MTTALAVFLGAFCAVLLLRLYDAAIGFLRTRYAARYHRPGEGFQIVYGPAIEPADEIPLPDSDDTEAVKAALVSEYERTRPVRRTGLHVVNYPVIEDGP